MNDHTTSGYLKDSSSYQINIVSRSRHYGDAKRSPVPSLDNKYSSAELKLDHYLTMGGHHRQVNILRLEPKVCPILDALNRHHLLEDVWKRQAVTVKNRKRHSMRGEGNGTEQGRQVLRHYGHCGKEQVFDLNNYNLGTLLVYEGIRKTCEQGAMVGVRWNRIGIRK
ncbi:hypothetical protein L218DRAFT_951668 [Marasmius fiardii PR-910]|nr:hypothetical protein L218DRAFT_951668 [Marasmius fiardii PR-910]